MSNVFKTADNRDTLSRLQQLKVLLEDYREAYPSDEYIHEAWLVVISKIDDLEPVSDLLTTDPKATDE